MADEAAITLSLTYVKSGVTIKKSADYKVDIDDVSAISSVILVGTSSELIYTGDTSAPGILLVHNMDATGNVYFSDDGTHYGCRVVPGEWMLTSWAFTTLYAKATPAPTLIEYTILPAGPPWETVVTGLDADPMNVVTGDDAQPVVVGNIGEVTVPGGLGPPII